MFGWLIRAISTSVGKKLVMAVSGLLLIGFLFVHLGGNLLLYAGEDGHKFDAYARAMDANPLIPIAEIGLFLLFAVHIYLGLRLSSENRNARRERYAVRASRGARTLASSSMIVTGVLVLLFLIVHLYDFRIGKLSVEDPAAGLSTLVRRRLAQPWVAIGYLAGVLALGIHLKHAFRSAFQSLGVSHPRLDPLLLRLSIALAVLLGVGFASFPLVYLWIGGSR